MNTVEINPQLRITCNKGSLYLRYDWLEYTPPGAPKTTAHGVKLMHRNSEYIVGRVAELNKMLESSKDSRFHGAVITVEGEHNGGK